jgi:hypothetical protein
MASTVDSASLKYEQAPNNETSSNTVSTVRRDFPVKNLSMDPAVALLERNDETRGTEDEPAGIVNGYQPAGSFTHNGYPDDIIFLLGLSGFQGTFTAGNGVITDPDGATIPTGASRWVFAKRGGNTPKTAEFTTVYADESQWLRLKGAGVTQLAMNADGELSGTLAALYFARLLVDPNLTPAVPATTIWPFRRIDLTLPTWLASTGVVSEFTWTITNPLEAIKTPAISSLYPDTILNANERVRMMGTVALRTLTGADIDAINQAKTFAAKVKYSILGTVIGATTYHPSMWIEMPNAQITGGTFDPLSNSRQFGSQLNWKATLDDATNKSVTITVVCGTASVSSVGN